MTVLTADWPPPSSRLKLHSDASTDLGRYDCYSCSGTYSLLVFNDALACNASQGAVGWRPSRTSKPASQQATVLPRLDACFWSCHPSFGPAHMHCPLGAGAHGAANQCYSSSSTARVQLNTCSSSSRGTVSTLLAWRAAQSSALSWCPCTLPSVRKP